MTAALLATTAMSIGSCSLSGNLDATAVAGTATSSDITVTVPLSNPGTLEFYNYSDSGTITATQYRIDAGSYTTIGDGGVTSAFTSGQTITARSTGVGAGESRQFDVRDATTKRYIGTYIHSA